MSVRVQMTKTMPQDPVDALIRRLAGSEPGGRSDRDPADEHMRLAAYLDGGMTPEEKAAFEQELAQSPDRREELLGAVAWFDELDAKRQPAPDHLVRQVLALERTVPRQKPEPWWRGWLPVSGRQWAFAAASVVASIAVAVVALETVRNTGGPPNIAEFNGSRERKPAVEGIKIPLSDALADALSAYDRNSGAQERAVLVAALKSARTIPFNLEGAAIEVAKPLHDRLQRSERPAAITVGLSLEGRVVLGPAD
jgi:hypothetical protein